MSIMEKLKKLIKILQEFNPIQELEKILKNNEKEIIALITREQIYKGISGDGGKITPPYSEGYKKWKTKEKLYQGHVDLHLSGTYLKSFEAQYKNDEVIIESDRSVDGFNLSQWLKGWYGSEVEDFTENHYNEILKLISKELEREIRKSLQSI